MKNRIICLVILILSLVAFAASFNSTQAYYHNSRGNSFFKEKKFDEARDEYNKSLKIKESNEVRNNIIKSLYEEKKYKEITETPSTEYFIRGNSYAFLGDEAVQQNPEEAIKNYKAALEEYKLAMKTSSDINIKKNYEIVLKKIEDLNSQNQQNQDNQKDKQDQNKDQDNKQDQQNKENQDKQNDKQDQQNNQNQDKQDQNKDQDNKQDQQNNQNQQNQDKQNDKQDQNKDQDNKQDQQNNQNQQNQDKQNDKQDQNKDQNDKQNSIPQGEVQPIDSKDDVREGEVRAILKRLEGNEKQSFKNNERVINIDTGNSNNRW
ncbi:tetratricopeptide repeat protein [Fusobacterium ulcerans]|uniref:tetratricopeptide repeat protein n=1 Tax=Fusobacterium ulcerans TaxID=861 RepID=UPI002673D8DE|nr:tetratricopeptide repeat protein [Fusobacterium ulcerans]